MTGPDIAWMPGVCETRISRGSTSSSHDVTGVVAAVARWGFRCGESGREAGAAGACGPGWRERGRRALEGEFHALV
jgi:hypothetical protein